ncbi:MAG: Radical SAM additional 4Fe4S-binding domain-containing protein [Promethearchaeota archaeon CR_4]|nr:MAG: Radical SAM additional 4Fe4S-binding domain-containing protein [Candidatus Lokiarchaeota archaeon CR_4]
MPIQLPTPIFPFTCALELTYTCNHQCFYCSCPWRDPHGKYPVRTPLSTDAWISLVDSIVARGVTNFILTGGEPTLLPEFPHIIAALSATTTSQTFLITPERYYARQYPVSFVILTNGDTETWTRSFCQSLSSLRCRIHVHVAGPPAMHDAITGGDCARTLQTVRFALDAGLDLVVNVPVLPSNVAVVGQTVRDVLTLGVRHINLMRVLPVGILRDRPDRLLSSVAFLSAIREVNFACQKVHATCEVGSLVPTCVITGNSLAGLSQPSLPHICGCGTISFCIDPSGLIRPCTCASVVGGEVPYFDEALGSDLFQSFCSRGHPPVCAGCSLQDQCSGGCPAVWYGQTDLLAGDPWVATAFPGGFVR